jgi:Tfp pilus assembly protein PilF
MVDFMKNFLMIIGFSILLPACTSITNTEVVQANFKDELFPNFNEVHIESSEDIFALDKEATDFVKKHTSVLSSQRDNLSSLLGAIFNRSELSLGYLASANTIASDTFHQQQANCLSLTIMMYAMTEELGMQATFQEILIPEFWTLRNGNTLLNGHINLRISPATVKNKQSSDGAYIVDFEPQRGLNKFTIKPLKKSEVISFFYTNKGADWLINGEPDKAYAYLRSALKENSQSTIAWLNMAVLYSRQGFKDEAEISYNNALKIDPSHNTVIENLARLYRQTGRESEANKLDSRLNKIRSKNPFFHLMEGDLALQQHKPYLAIEHYEKALKLDKKNHMFYYAMARAYDKIGDVKNTERYLEKARIKAGNNRIAKEYASKLNTLLASRPLSVTTLQ